MRTATLKLRVNGHDYEVDVPADTPLLWALREELGLKGTKFGCGRGLCGACTIHLGGAPTRSCVLPVAAAAGVEITTIEGIGTPEHPHPVQAAWIELNVPQCGYCQCGQIMSAIGLLARHPSPSAAAIDEGMSGNLCRCGTYERIRAGITLAASRTKKK